MKRQPLSRAGILVAALFSFTHGASTLRAADKHPFGLDDYSAIRSGQAAAVSPDGKTILYLVTFTGTKGKETHEWYTISSSGENPKKLNLPENFDPAGFMKDGTSLYGNYEVEKLAQLAIVPLLEGKPTRIISLPTGIHGVHISPDGTRLMISADPRPKDPSVTGQLDAYRNLAARWTDWDQVRSAGRQLAAEMLEAEV